VTNGEARALAQEFNKTVEQGRVLWEQASALCKQCNDIRARLDAAGVQYDEIALLFGGELDPELIGPDDRDVSA
jgi:hypothetical protein